MTSATVAASPADQDPWSQLAGLYPRLHSHLEFHRHQYRGQYWFVIADKLTASHFRCNEVTHNFLRLLDGSHCVEQALTQVTEQHPDGGLEQAEIIRLLASLRESNMLQGLGGDPSGSAHPRAQSGFESRALQILMRPLGIRLPLLDPDQLLSRLLPWVSPLFSTASFVFWALLVGWSALLGLTLWPALTSHWSSRFLDLTNLLWLWPLYPLVKGLHELGHGFAVRRWGGEVHEMGIMLLVFMPVPYVDASSSNAFAHKRQRMLVAAAGIMVELFIAALALLAWVQLAPGFARDMAFNIAFIGGASTLLFNGNPLLRFDGYYVLADALEIPNLSTRSTQYLGYLLKRYALRLTNLKSPVTAASERGWLFGYAIAAGLYRLSITFSIALFVAGKFFFAGIALACWFLITQLVMPFIKMLRRLIPLVSSQGQRLRLAIVGGGTLLIVFGALFWMPIPHSTHAQGIINLAEDASVRAQADGFIVLVLRRNGEAVAIGDPLFQLENTRIVARLELLRARQAELQARYQEVIIKDRNAAGRIKDELKAVAAEYADIEREYRNLRVVSPVAGRFALSREEDLQGRYVSKGDVLGHVVELSSVNARVVVSQQAVDRVRRRTEAVEVKLYSEPRLTLRSTLLREVPSATNQLPSRILGSQAGGDIAVDARDEQGLQAIDPIFQFDIQLPPRADGAYLGQSLAVRFIHSNEPLGLRLLRKFRQLVQRKLDS